MKRVPTAALGLAVLLAIPGTTARGVFVRLYSETFESDPSATWSYSGVTNAAGQDLFRYDSVADAITAEWDQSNRFQGVPSDPYVIEPSCYLHDMGRTLTDSDTFRIGARLVIEPGAVPETTEFYQIANLGLYNPATTGPDRIMSDNFSGNTTIVKDAGDFVEFSYFINNNSFGFNPNISAVIGAHITSADGDYTTGSSSDAGYFHDTDMGADHWLPEGTNLYVDLVYHGAATNADARRAYCAVYTDPSRTNLLVVNGVPMYYWTQPLATGKTFSVTHVGFCNYVGANWGGVNGEGRGAWHDISIDESMETMTALLEDGFDADPSGRWEYEGVTNTAGEDLFGRRGPVPVRRRHRQHRSRMGPVEPL
jgi:hypothetical protein